MKWIKIKHTDRYSLVDPGYKGKKNNIIFEIKAYTEGWKRNHLGWYISLNNKITNKSYNSLWNNIWFKELEDAQKWCEDYSE